MLPPTLGGPGIHAKKLYEYFSAGHNHASDIFVFEKLNKYGAGIRHAIAFFQILTKSRGAEIILALDGFSVALPAILVGAMTRKKVMLRIGGDLVHEQYVEQSPVDMESFYKNLQEKKLQLSKKLRIKLYVQEYIIKNADGIIFTSNWQKNIYSSFYSLPKNTWVVQNPVEYEEVSLEKQEESSKSEKIFLSASRDVEFKNIKTLKKAFAEVARLRTDILLDTNISSREELLKRMLNARCYVNVSLSDISPNTVLDAIALRLPIILTKNTGLYETLKDSGVCRFIDPFNQADIESAIIEMCDEQIWSSYEQASRSFRWPQTWETLFLEYEKALSDILK